MIGKNDDVAQDWYRFSMMDLISAKHLCSLHPKPLEIICYHCQQSAEKLLKGFLVSNGIDPPKTHDLIDLRIMCSKINEKFEELKEICKSLNPYSIQPRYPNEIEILETDAEKALQDIQAMVDFFKEQGQRI
jgi:HEPN domain-containing protein